MTKPTFRFEKKLWRRGFKFVAGADEVGRGCFAGCVAAAVVVFTRASLDIFAAPDVPRIDDSKKLTGAQREKAASWIKKKSLAYGVGVGSVAEINRLGMARATHSAFRRAIIKVNRKVQSRVDYLLVDAFYIPYVRGLKVGIKNSITERRNPKHFNKGSRQLPIIDGDEKSISVAAASIIAKVYRDKVMINLGKKSPFTIYGWERNKGYGTQEHQGAIKKYGITKYHRKKFVETFLTTN